MLLDTLFSLYNSKKGFLYFLQVNKGTVQIDIKEISSYKC